MKFTIVRKELIEGLNHVIKAVSNKVTLPILTGIKLELTTKGLTMIGSDSDITICSFIPVEKDGIQLIQIEKEGSIVLQGRYFNDIVRKLPKDELSIEVNEQYKTVIRSGNSEFNLIGQDAIEYPVLPSMENEQSFTMSSTVLKSIIKETVFAVSQNETRPTLTGVHWEIKNEKLYCVATDSHRLARRITQLDQLPEVFSAVIPGKSLQELNKIIDDEDRIDIVMADQQVLFKTADLLFYSRLLEGTYPDTSRLIPTDYQTSIQVNGKELLQAIDRASLLAREERNNIVKFSATNDQRIQVSSHSPEIGNVEEVLEAIEITGEELEISFSSKYMMDALKAIEEEQLIIRFTGVMRPFIIQAVDSEEVLQLILPVRTF